MNYNKLKKIDLESLQKLKEGTGPSDKCLCALLAPPDDNRKGLRASIKKAFASFGPGKKGRKRFSQKTIDIPLSALSNAGKPLRTKKELVRRKTSCGKCGCDKEDVVLKHSFAKIRITSPDVSSFCTCPSKCLPGNDKLKNNIKVTIEHLMVYNADSSDSEVSIYEFEETETPPEPKLERKSVTSLIKAQYDCLENN